jgi:hypothetical protein
MNTRRFPIAGRLFLLPLLLMLSILSFPDCVFGQKLKTAGNKVFPFGIKDTARTLHVTYDQILKNPKLICSDSKCKIKSFEISYVVAKGEDPYMGPFQISGAELTPVVKDLIAKLKKSDSKKTRMFIEEIRVTRKGVEETLNPIALVCNP